VSSRQVRRWPERIRRPLQQLETISPRPLLVIAGSKADTLFWRPEVYEKAREPKEPHVIEGATHIDM